MPPMPGGLPLPMLPMPGAMPPMPGGMLPMPGGGPPMPMPIPGGIPLPGGGTVYYPGMPHMPPMPGMPMPGSGPPPKTLAERYGLPNRTHVGSTKRVRPLPGMRGCRLHIKKAGNSSFWKDLSHLGYDDVMQIDAADLEV